MGILGVVGCGCPIANSILGGFISAEGVSGTEIILDGVGSGTILISLFTRIPNSTPLKFKLFIIILENLPANSKTSGEPSINAGIVLFVFISITSTISPVLTPGRISIKC
ncbi:hypothetical protein ES703_104055 [subsurface metagenome]